MHSRHAFMQITMSTKDLVPFYDLHLWTFERLGETVQLCKVYWPLEDFDKTDEIVTQLYLIIDEVEVLIPILRDERSPDLNTLIELHAALFQLLALWEAKLATLDGSRAHHHVNRQGLGRVQGDVESTSTLSWYVHTYVYRVHIARVA